jgi:hypothetical protein
MVVQAPDYCLLLGGRHKEEVLGRAAQALEHHPLEVAHGRVGGAQVGQKDAAAAGHEPHLDVPPLHLVKY